SLRDGARALRRAARWAPRPFGLQHHQSGVLRDRSLARLRARLLVSGGARALADRVRHRRLRGRPGAVGPRAPKTLRRALRPGAAVNPTWTIQAVALYIADGIIRRRS